MRKVVVWNLVTLDGFFEGAEKELDWFVVNEEFINESRDMFKEFDTILFGRKTYQMMEKYWPTAEDNDPTITHHMNKLSKIVFSKTLEEVSWNNSRLINENITEEVHEMKKLPGKDMVIFGSGEIVSALTKAHLIDEFRIILNPVILGEGNTMFKNIKEKINLILKKVQTLKSGVAILYYTKI